MYIENETLPLFNNWTSSCQANTTSVTYNDYPLQVYAGEVDIPPWAFISPRGNFSFDISEALERESSFGSYGLCSVIDIYRNRIRNKAKGLVYSPNRFAYHHRRVVISHCRSTVLLLPSENPPQI